MQKGRRYIAGACDCSAQRNGRVFIAEAPAADRDGAVFAYDGAPALEQAIAGGAGPMAIASSACSTWSECRSGSE